MEKTCNEVLNLGRQRKQLRPEGKKSGELITRKRSIFYDTDNILETQEETVRLCDDCGGALRIDSTAGRRMLGVHIPWKGCAACRETGLKWFAEADTQYHHVFLQDRVADRYVEKEK